MNSNNKRSTATPIPPSLQAKLAAFQANRAATASNNSIPSLEAALQAASLNSPSRPLPKPAVSGLAQRIQTLKASTPGPSRRPKPAFTLRDIDPSLVPPAPTPILGGGGIAGAGLGAGRPANLPPSNAPFSSPFANFSKIVDPSGALNFNGKAILHASGVNFENGASFAINMSQLHLDDEELGKGNYGTVKKVLHKPTNVAMAMKEIRLELDQAKLNAIIMELDVLHRAVAPEIIEFYGAFFIESCVYYCMEYMDAGSLDKLTQSGPNPSGPNAPPPPVPDTDDLTSSADDIYSFAMPFDNDDIDFNDDQHFYPYNTAFNRSNVACYSHYDGGPIPEAILGRIVASMTRGLKFLKDELNIIHRDVKPTNVLVNRKGEVKLCDFGVSGQLDKSLARTNIGCQSYMAPERIQGESRVVSVVATSNVVTPGTAQGVLEGNVGIVGSPGGVPGTAALADELYGAYTVSSDVWSLGLSVIELGLGRYPYPPETYSNVFAQLTAIVHGTPPCLPSGPPPLSSAPPLNGPGSSKPTYSPLAQDWVNKCMKKSPSERATYKALLEHPWLIKNEEIDVDMVGWVQCALQAKELRAKGR